ncbi:MAG: hypothetical protein AAF206_26455 [Bacteroidota bacterium]
MNRTRSFATRDGYCHLYSDRIEIEQSGGLRKWLDQKGIRREAALYLLAVILFAILALVTVLIENYFLAIFFAGVMLVSLFTAFSQRNTSFAFRIPRSQIEEVHYFPAQEGMSRASFRIDYRSGKSLLKRWVKLPGKTQNGNAIAQSAYWMMKEEGLLAETP